MSDGPKPKIPGSGRREGVLVLALGYKIVLQANIRRHPRSLPGAHIPTHLSRPRGKPHFTVLVTRDHLLKCTVFIGGSRLAVDGSASDRAFLATQTSK